MPRYLLITEGRYLGEEWLNDNVIFVEEDDGTLRPARGDDLLEIDRRFPGLLGDRNLTRLD